MVHKGAQSGDLDTIRRIVASGVDVDVRNGAIYMTGRIENQTSLHVAAHSGKIKAAELLLSLGADIEARDRCYETPLHHAVMGFPNLAMVEFLLDNGADINAKTDYGTTPLIMITDYAEERVGALPILELLLERGAAGVEDAIKHLLWVEKTGCHSSPMILSILQEAQCLTS